MINEALAWQLRIGVFFFVSGKVDAFQGFQPEGGDKLKDGTYIDGHSSMTERCHWSHKLPIRCVHRFNTGESVKVKTGTQQRIQKILQYRLVTVERQQAFANRSETLNGVLLWRHQRPISKPALMIQCTEVATTRMKKQNPGFVSSVLTCPPALEHFDVN